MRRPPQPPAPWLEYEPAVDLSEQNIGGWTPPGDDGRGEAWDTRPLARIVQQLKSNKSITQLDLQRNHLDPEAMEVLSELFTLRRYLHLVVRSQTIEFEE